MYDAEGATARHFAAWDARRTLAADPRWRDVLAEIALYGWRPEAPRRFVPRHDDSPPPPEPPEGVEEPVSSSDEEPREEIALTDVAFHALLHAVRLGDASLRPRLAAVADDTSAPDTRRAAARAALVAGTNAPK